MRVLKFNANYKLSLVPIEEFADVMRDHTREDRQRETNHKFPSFL